MNHYYRRAKYGGMFMSAEGKAYKATIGWQVRRQVHGLLAGRLGIKIEFYVSTDRGDGDNLLKAFLDSLQGIVFANDRQIKHYEFDVIKDKKNPRIECRVWELNGSKDV